jgi:putative DNA primase/helicase
VNGDIPPDGGGIPVEPEGFEYLTARRASDIEPTKVDWHWPGWLPKGRLLLLSGRPGDGKTALSLDIMARLSRGTVLPDGHQPGEPIIGAILSAEDDASDTIVPRLMAAQADLRNCMILEHIEDRGEKTLGTTKRCSVARGTGATRAD